ncbi:glycosyltransferase [Gordonia insulae]|uniref:Glycosyl transferase family 1 domain-containing protein n=1 Tax=Gordonia insulae TaxID=2420509 RepID=A0A3G8JU58_9ACTN|nr:glycosyltransferase [Gordonia insulae]AZG48089.1 hypothetical protein D7316_04702 [Gordonia insulae]
MSAVRESISPSRLSVARTIVMYLAVVPWYRTECVRMVNSKFAGGVKIFAASYALDETVRTGIPRDRYTEVSRRQILGGRLLATGLATDAVWADECIVDLNPRSLSAWLILVVRRVRRARVIVWGHLYPRAGAGASTAGLRRLMRRLADGVITYDYDGAAAARAEIPSQPVWTAPNALYKADDMTFVPTADRTAFVYIGRLVVEKKVDQLIPAFAASGVWRRGCTLEIVGGGDRVDILHKQFDALEDVVKQSVFLRGSITDTGDIRQIYSRSLCAVSPGYVGLSATQSLSFGVPMLYSQNEPHAPEIELTSTGAMKSYDDGTVDGLARAMDEVVDSAVSITDDSRTAVVDYMREFYSAEAMAGGIINALSNLPHLPESAPGGRVIEWFDE